MLTPVPGPSPHLGRGTTPPPPRPPAIPSPRARIAAASSPRPLNAVRDGRARRDWQGRAPGLAESAFGWEWDRGGRRRRAARLSQCHATPRRPLRPPHAALAPGDSVQRLGAACLVLARPSSPGNARPAWQHVVAPVCAAPLPARRARRRGWPGGPAVASTRARCCPALAPVSYVGGKRRGDGRTCVHRSTTPRVACSALSLVACDPLPLRQLPPLLARRRCLSTRRSSRACRRRCGPVARAVCGGRRRPCTRPRPRVSVVPTLRHTRPQWLRRARAARFTSRACLLIRANARTDDKRLQNTLKRLGVNTIPGIEEVNLFKVRRALFAAQAAPALRPLAAFGLAITRVLARALVRCAQRASPPARQPAAHLLPCCCRHRRCCCRPALCTTGQRQCDPLQQPQG